MPVEEVFRFVNVRPVHKAPPQNIKKKFISKGPGKTKLQQELEKITGVRREAAVAIARKRLETGDADLAGVDDLIDAASRAAAEPTAGKAKKAVEARLGQKLPVYIRSRALQLLSDALWERVYAHTLAPEIRPQDRELVFDGLRALHALRLLLEMDDQAKPLTRAQIEAIRPLVPRDLVPESPQGNDARGVQAAAEARAALAKVAAKVQELHDAIGDIRSGNEAYEADATRRPIVITKTRAAGDRRPPNQEDEPDEMIEVVQPEPWLFTEFAKKTLSPKTIALLDARKKALAGEDARDVMAKLNAEKYAAASQYVHSLSNEARAVVVEEDQYRSLLGNVPIPNAPAAVGTKGPKPQPSPTARGIRPLGIGDLLLVRQELQRYVTGEVAHIENALKGEIRSRVHSRMRETEETIITETERLEETEKDLQTTERFELHKETQKTIEKEWSIDAGVSVTAGFGPVSVSAHADFALGQSMSETNSTSSTIAKDITDRSIARLKQRSREERTRRTLERFEEKNEHGIDNKAGSGHVVGVYRWVDKIYKHRLVNYGKRLMFEFIIPEPAAFYVFLQAHRAKSGITMKKPSPPTVSGEALTPALLQRDNYQHLLATYSVRDAEPCPAETIKLSVAVADAAAPGTGTLVEYAKTFEKLQIPEGRVGHTVYGHGWWHGSNVKVYIAGSAWGKHHAKGVEGVVPISVMGKLSRFNINIVVECLLTPQAFEAWQLKTYEAIMAAYERQLADYQEHVASVNIQSAIQIEGNNPGVNRKIERDELRKGVLRQLTNNFSATRVNGTWRYNETFNAMRGNQEYGYPEADVATSIVEGRIIQFFEQAFEWNNLTYRFYPYFWGRKENWDTNYLISDPDPQFMEFLRAGAARVIVPVHPLYNETVLHYLATNEIWNGGKPPTIDDPLYVSIVDELKADSGAELDEELPACTIDSGVPCQVDEWEVKLPTTLVYLQEDAVLPDFT